MVLGNSGLDLIELQRKTCHTIVFRAVNASGFSASSQATSVSGLRPARVKKGGGSPLRLNRTLRLRQVSLV